MSGKIGLNGLDPTRTALLVVPMVKGVAGRSSRLFAGFSSTVPSRQALGQRALGLPTVLVVNESSLSDSEDFTEGYRTLGLGKVVGVPTAGWIIFTGGRPLIDGSMVRVPGYRIRDSHGQDMEMHPRPVDVEVERQLGETESGHDAQLEKAVQVLLGN